MMTESSPTTPKPTLRTKFLVALAAVSISCAFIVIAFMLGSFVAGTSLHDPDTCWLMALGHLIYTNGHLPPSDPFSYTFAQLNLPFIMYQWLTEFVFFLLYQFLGLPGMVMSLAVLAAITLLVLPLLTSKQLPHTRLFCCGATLVLALSATTHILIRPEIFSYFLLAIWMMSITLWRKRIFLNEKSGLKQAMAFILLMLAWANLHTAFMIALVALLVVATCYAIESQLVAKVPANEIKLWYIAFAGAFAATFLNPNFDKLWAYLPSLYFSPINQYIDELKPIAGGDLHNPTYYPFLVQALISIALLIRQLKFVAKNKSTIATAPGAVFSLVAVVVCIYGGLVARRLMPFAAIILAWDSLFMVYAYKALHPQSLKSGFIQMLETCLEELFKPTVTNCLIVFGCAALFGAYITVSRIAPPQIPMGSYAFKVPEKAVEFLKTIQPEGNVFNDAQYGDVLIWKMPKHPLVFVDTRFDMYGAEFLRQYQAIRFADSNCDELLNKYQIAWIFVPLDSPLARHLQNSTNWKALYRDDVAVILLKLKAQ